MIVKKLLSIATILIVGVFVNLNASTTKHEKVYEFKDLNGNNLTFTVTSVFKVKQFNNKIILLDLSSYSSTLNPSLRVLVTNQLIEIQKKYKDDVQVIGLDRFDENSKDTVAEFIKENKIAYPVILNNEESRQFISLLDTTLNINGMWPSIVVFDKNGYFVHVVIGIQEKIEDWVQLVLDPQLKSSLEEQLSEYIMEYLIKNKYNQQKYKEAVKIIAQLYVDRYGKKAKKHIYYTIESHPDMFLKDIENIAEQLKASKADK